MIFYLLYKLGCSIAIVLPVSITYWIAARIADMFRLVSARDRNAVMANLRVVLAEVRPSDIELVKISRCVFRNFAKYLVDFFRFSKMDREYIKKFIKIEGLANIDAVLSKGRGAIVLSAHIGNWELGGFVLASIGYPLSAVVLTHQNKKINDFFTRQRMLSGMKPIEIGASLRSCYVDLKGNRLLALLGDRDFSRTGLNINFFGKRSLIPKGPAVLSRRLGCPIVPTFMIRQEDDTFTLFIEEPILPDGKGEEDQAVEGLANRYVAIIERYVKRYPEQWYMFRKVWNDNGKKFLRPDTII